MCWHRCRSKGSAPHVEALIGPAYFHDLTNSSGWGGGNEDIGWYANAPHPNAARLFVNWYLSKEFQQQYAVAEATAAASTPSPATPIPPLYYSQASPTDAGRTRRRSVSSGPCSRRSRAGAFSGDDVESAAIFVHHRTTPDGAAQGQRQVEQMRRVRVALGLRLTKHRHPSLAIAVSALMLMWAGAAAAQQPWQQDWAKTLEAARKEGVVNVSGPPGPGERETALAAWAKAFPDIQLLYTGARGTQILSQVVRERQSGLYNWDVVLASTDPTVFMLPPIHALAPLKDALIDPAVLEDKNWNGGFEEGFLDAAGKYFYAGTGVAGFTLGYVNRDCVSRQDFSKSDDLMKPAFKGKIGWHDPLLPGTGSRSTWRLAIDKGNPWLKQLYLDQQVTFSRDYRQLAEWLVTCSKPIVIGLPNDALLPLQEQGIGKNLEELSGKAYFGDHGIGWAGANDDIGWYNNAPHPAAAKIFVNFYLSQDFQQVWSKTNHTDSRRTDVTPGDPNPNAALDPGVTYAKWGDEASIRWR